MLIYFRIKNRLIYSKTISKYKFIHKYKTISKYNKNTKKSVNHDNELSIRTFPFLKISFFVYFFENSVQIQKIHVQSHHETIHDICWKLKLNYNGYVLWSKKHQPNIYDAYLILNKMPFVLC